jgi:hypothetical protein
MYSELINIEAWPKVTDTRQVVPPHTHTDDVCLSLEVTEYFIQQLSEADWLTKVRDSRCAGASKTWAPCFMLVGSWKTSVMRGACWCLSQSRSVTPFLPAAGTVVGANLCVWGPLVGRASGIRGLAGVPHTEACSVRTLNIITSQRQYFVASCPSSCVCNVSGIT